jgi:flagellar protein FlbD
MIQLEKMNGDAFYVNPDHIRYLDSTPDTILTFQDGQKIAVKTAVPEVIDRIINFRKSIQISVER